MRRPRAEFLVLSLDIGSSSTRAALFDNQARPVARTDARVPYSIAYTSEGGAELAPATLRRAVRHAFSATLLAHEKTPVRGRLPIRTMATSAFWHGLLGLDRQWRPVTPIYMWNDARAARDARSLRAALSERDIQARTGCMLRTSFWPAKLTWLRRTQPQVFRRAKFWVSPVDWLYHEFFGTRLSSASMASATGLFNLARRTWDNELCAACGIDDERLPRLTAAAEPLHLPRAIRNPLHLFTPIGDGAAGNLGSGADRKHLIAINVGTSAAVRVIQSNDEAKATTLPLGLFRYIVDADRSVMGGAVSNAGNLRQWGLREFRLNQDRRSERLLFARDLAARNPLVALPFWSAERAPTWPDARGGAIDGITYSSNAADLMRALACSVFYRLADILDLITTAGVRPGGIIISGGIVRSTPEVRLLADAIGRDVAVANEGEASLRGAAVYALQQSGAEIAPLRRGSLIRHDQKLTDEHMIRRRRQHALEKALTNDDL